MNAAGWDGFREIRPTTSRTSCVLVTALIDDGRESAASVVSRKRAVLHNAFDYAVERNLLSRNVLPELKWTPPKSVRSIDKRTVVNPEQAGKLLDAMRE